MMQLEFVGNGNGGTEKPNVESNKETTEEKSRR